MLTDQKLIKDIKSGSQSAMDVLVKRHYKLVYSFMYRKTSNKSVAYDLTQEVFIKMLKKIDRYSFSGEFKNWLLTIAVNHCRDYYRSKAYRESTDNSEFKDNLHREKDDITYIFNKNETRKQIKEALSTLPDMQKEAIILKYFHDLKINEIAEITETNSSTVKSRLKQGMKKLEIILKGSDFFEETNRGKC
ncbi:RNA polymerase sigma factor [Anaerobacillus sp. 1_MG-2023]|uniref:RNA polymerase sigma factor n=1 Tax=Anaerobacillus sp. 1_MG-2023 TaxID=3062655 RepID=UPI0026E1F9E9|nr:RNA polymerase sigma factor [Anaerobacillus sp. 1_MG-2023]MDO6658729.1 RNA polymerase sigma factor [Anaerobacillus sp. 1_MG-2023]